MTKDEAAIRQAEILGQPLRVQPLPQSALGGAKDLAQEIGDVLGIEAPEELTTYFAVMYKHPGIYRCQMATGIMFLGEGSIPPLERELAILRTAWQCGAPYEWAEHVSLAHILEMPPEWIERVTLGLEAEGWSDHHRAILMAVDQLHLHQMIDDVTWGVLAANWSEQQLLELPALVGQYTAVAMIQNSLRIPLGPEREGLYAR